MPKGEIPHNAYEDRKVVELSERIRSHEGSRSSDVHIIAGRKKEQVRRIAFLTAMKLLKSGSDVVPVSSFEYPDKTTGRSGAYPVFLLDEEQIRDNTPEVEEPDPERVSRIMDYLRSNYGKNHAIFLSICQDTYESRFKDGLGRSIDLDSVENSGSKKLSPNRFKANKQGNRYWYAFIFPALSFLLSPIRQYFTVNGDPFALNTIGFSIFQSFAYPALFVAPVLLSVAGLVLLFAFARGLSGTAKKVLAAGMAMFLAEIIIPLFLLITGVLSMNEQLYSSPALGNYMLPSTLFLAFQSAAAVSFLLIPFMQSTRIQKACLGASFILALAFLVAMDALASQNLLNINLTYQGIPVVFPLPFIPPYNTIFFGFLYGNTYYLYGWLNTLPYLAQFGFAAAYFSVAIGQGRRSRSSSEWKGEVPDARSA
ncbi:hypothetical protein IX51_02665 [uncultured archaeon]|nr:hypothetical protein IX51_02665 [uncultured archaeon]